MFFPEKIKNIKSTDRVLEVGPGSLPYFRSDVFLEKVFSEEESVAQRGFADSINIKKKIVYYDGGRFPFLDKEFDYVICSHVIEHIPSDDLPLFISELQRVAGKGYIEFPTVFYEFICYPLVHLWFMNYRNDCIHFLNKEKFKSNFIHKIYRDMVYNDNFISEKLFSNYQELFFCGFEWNQKIDYKIVNNFNDLINESDYIKYKKYFGNKKKDSSIRMIIKKIFNYFYRALGVIKRKII